MYESGVQARTINNKNNGLGDKSKPASLMQVQLNPSVIQRCPVLLRDTRARGSGCQRIHAPDVGLFCCGNLYVDAIHSVNEGVR